MGLGNISASKAILMGTLGGFATAGGVEAAHNIYGKLTPGAPGSEMPESLMWMHSPAFSGTMGTLTAVASAGLMILGHKKVPAHALNGAKLLARNENLGRIGMGMMGGSMASMSLAMAGGGHGNPESKEASAGNHHGGASTAAAPAHDGATESRQRPVKPFPPVRAEPQLAGSWWSQQTEDLPHRASAPPVTRQPNYAETVAEESNTSEIRSDLAAESPAGDEEHGSAHQGH